MESTNKDIRPSLHKSKIHSKLNRLLSIILTLAILGTTGAIIYIVISPDVGEKFTEFYILGSEGKAKSYPREIVLGESGNVLLGIVSQEYGTAGYRVEIRIGNEKVDEYEILTLEHGEKWEHEISITPVRAGLNQKVEFMLYKDGDTEVYRTLHFWIEVSE